MLGYRASENLERGRKGAHLGLALNTSSEMSVKHLAFLHVQAPQRIASGHGLQFGVRQGHLVCGASGQVRLGRGSAALSLVRDMDSPPPLVERSDGIRADATLPTSPPSVHTPSLARTRCLVNRVDGCRGDRPHTILTVVAEQIHEQALLRQPHEVRQECSVGTAAADAIDPARPIEAERKAVAISDASAILRGLRRGHRLADASGLLDEKPIEPVHVAGGRM